ncbi:GNAT family N-acetyltransferase [Desulfolucanica intricata]|uniref:GNAT family N-acetyltransferase n=1 Tax=Desulfolucanica intricata TaxID=1285191 RepID=UPI000836FF77|nr:GNAT family N-acetyltransferase [Desulfolucanica intricata]
MKGNISIRKMENVKSEVERLSEFLYSIDRAFFIPLSEKVNIDSYAVKILTKGVVLIAEFEEQIIGSLLGYANDQTSHMAYISTFGLLESYRGYGIGYLLLSAMKEICIENGMKYICLYTHKTNDSAIRFYKRNGFVEKDDPGNRNDDVYLVCNLLLKNKKNVNPKANILVTAIGSYSADIVIKTLKSHGHYVVGCDINPKEWVADAYNVNQFYQAPYINDKEKYIAFIEKTCEKHKIEYVFPLTDPEVDLLSHEKDRLFEKNIHVCISNAQTIKLCRDKCQLSTFLLNHGINNVIPTKYMGDVDIVELPAFIKPISGRSSEGCRAVFDEKEYAYLKDTISRNKYIVQPYIQGNILTVDVIRDPITDEVVCIARRELLRNKSGAGTTVEIIENMELEALCISIARKVGIIGAVNFEFIESDDGEIYLLEINPRFSGGLEFSHLAGYDVVNNHLKCFTGKLIDKKGLIKRMIIARKYEEYVTQYIDN